MVATIPKEKRDCVTVDWSGFFLQTEQDEREYHLILKLPGAVTLLLVKSDKPQWRRHPRQRKWE